jgi:hypothetical protein
MGTIPKVKGPPQKSGIIHESLLPGGEVYNYIMTKPLVRMPNPNAVTVDLVASPYCRHPAPQGSLSGVRRKSSI